MDVVAVRDSQNCGVADDLPPVLLHSMSKLRPANLSEIIASHPDRLQRAGWSKSRIDSTERNHRELQHMYRSESWFKDQLDKCSDLATSFEDGWSLCQGKFSELRQSAGGLSSIFQTKQLWKLTSHL